MNFRNRLPGIDPIDEIWRRTESLEIKMNKFGDNHIEVCYELRGCLSPLPSGEDEGGVAEPTGVDIGLLQRLVEKFQQPLR